MELPSGTGVLILTEPEYAGGSHVYRRRLAKLYSTKKTDSAVICVRSDRTPFEDFQPVQTFCVIDLGLSLIPISDQLDRHLHRTIAQLPASHHPAKRSKNPYQFGANRGTLTSYDRAKGCLAAVSGSLGERKAEALLKNYGSLEGVRKADFKTLAQVVGPGPSKTIRRFFDN